MADGRGKVYLVGAGPGHPGLLTQRGAEVLGRCEVVVYDQQIEAVIRPHLRPDAELIRVTINEPGASDEANRLTHLVVDQAKRGLSVGRVTLGDPFLVGRAGREVLVCREHGIPIEVVPGVSLALAGPAFSGIPVLQPGLARALTVVAGPYSEPKVIGGMPTAGAQASPSASGAVPSPAPKAAAAPKKPGVNITRRKKEAPTRVPAPAPPAKVVPLAPPGRNTDYWSPDDTCYASDLAQAPESRPMETTVAPPAAATPPMVTDEEGRDWRALARTDTLVILNVTTAIDWIREALLLAGRPGADSCAYIVAPGTARQLTVGTTLSELSRDMLPRRPRDASLLVLGDVVNLRATLSFHEERPFFGERVVRLEPGSSQEVEELEEQGAQVRTVPIQLPQPVAGLASIVESLRDDIRLATYMVFADLLSAEHFFRALREARIDLRLLPERCEIIATTEETRDFLTGLHLTSTLLDGGFSAARLLDYLDDNLRAERVIVAGPCGMSPDLGREVRIRGGQATEIPVYDLLPVPENIQRLREELGRGEATVLAARQAQSLALLAEHWGQEVFASLMEHVVVATSGRAATKKAQELGVPTMLRATGSEPKSLAALLLESPRSREAHATPDPDEPADQRKSFGGGGRSSASVVPSSATRIERS